MSFSTPSPARNPDLCTTPMQHFFHPTDLSADSATAFVHALRMATLMRAQLTIMHVTDEAHVEDVVLPDVRARLAAWGLIADAHDLVGLEALGVGVRKVVTGSDDPVGACVRYLAGHPTDLIVLATHQREDRIGWVQDRVAEPLARESGRPALFLPHGRPGFVHAASGVVRLRRILVPVAPVPAPDAAIQAAAAFAASLADAPVQIHLLHVGDSAEAPRPHLPTTPGITWTHTHGQGEVHEVIVAAATDMEADLIVMATKGHDGFLDVLRGNTTERVLRHAECPVLAVV